jgi:hypothetical protein
MMNSSNDSFLHLYPTPPCLSFDPLPTNNPPALSRTWDLGSAAPCGPSWTPHGASSFPCVIPRTN